MATSTESLRPAPAVRPHDLGLASRSPWVRLALPSFADCFFMALMTWLFVCGASGWKALLMDGDTGWHIRAGEYILANHHVPTQDLFSFSRPGAPWFAWEWLTDVLWAALFHAGGLKAIVLFAGTLIGVFATLLLRYTIWRGANGLLAALTTLLAVGSSTVHFLARPHLFTLLLLPACLWLIEADRRKNTRWIWALIPVTAVWTNLHGGFLVFLACLALLTIGSAAEALLGQPRWEAARRYALVLLGCAAASLLNPNGVGLHRHILQYLQSDWIKNLIQEFQAPTFRSEGQFQYEVLLVAGLVLTGLLLRKQRITEAFWVLFLAHSSLVSLRHAPLFAAVAAPLVATELSAAWKVWAARLSKSSIPRIIHQLGEEITVNFRWTSVWPLGLILVLAVLDAPVQWPKDFPAEAFPAAMVHQNAAILQTGRLLTTDQWGDYLIYSFYPSQRVFIDGRSDFYGEALGREYLHLLQGAYDWRSIMQRHDFTAALLPVDWPLASLLKRDGGWRVAADDGHTILFTRLGQQSQVK